MTGLFSLTIGILAGLYLAKIQAMTKLNFPDMMLIKCTKKVQKVVILLVQVMITDGASKVLYNYSNGLSKRLVQLSLHNFHWKLLPVKFTMR